MIDNEAPWRGNRELADRDKEAEAREARIAEAAYLLRVECAHLNSAIEELVFDVCGDSTEFVESCVRHVVRNYDKRNNSPDDTNIGRLVRKMVDDLLRAKAAWRVDQTR